MARLRARARARGVSLEQSLRDLLTAAGRSLDLAAMIREDRDGS